MPEQLQLTEEQRKQLEEKIRSMSPEELKEFQKKQCLFCQIVAGKIPSKKLYEDETLIAVLDINPAVKGHLLLLPKEHYAIMPQVPDLVLRQLVLASKYLSQILLRVFKADGTNVFLANGPVAGQKSQHFMFHLFPRKEGDHVLNVEEKLVNEELQKKAALVTESKLNEILFGTKKEKESKEKEPKEKSTGEKERKISAKQKRTKSQKEESKDNNEEDASQKKEDVSLDDIADLFR